MHIAVNPPLSQAWLRKPSVIIPITVLSTEKAWQQDVPFFYKDPDDPQVSNTHSIK